jgi:hypothetical protein
MKMLLCQGRSAVVTAFIANAVIILAIGNSQAAPVDDLRVLQLEQDVRELQNQVRQQSRRIDALENTMRQSGVGVAAPPRSSSPAEAKTFEVTAAWLKSANWDKVKPGMSEADVVSVLGPPTTSRVSEKGATQTLFYALELEAGGFLTGRVIIADHRVLEIHKPELK